MADKNETKRSVLYDAMLVRLVRYRPPTQNMFTQRSRFIPDPTAVGFRRSSRLEGVRRCRRRPCRRCRRRRFVNTCCPACTPGTGRPKTTGTAYPANFRRRRLRRRFVPGTACRSASGRPRTSSGRWRPSPFGTSVAGCSRLAATC